MGRKYLQKLTSKGIDVSLCDLDPSKKVEGVRFFSNLDDALEEDYEIAIVAIDPSGHVRVCQTLLQRGIRVLVEKPPATSLEEFLSIYNYENLRVSEIERFSLCANLLQKPRASLDIYRFGKTKGYLSPIYDLAWHDLYLLQTLGEITLSALTRRNNIWVIKGFLDEIEFSLAVAWEHPSPMRLWRIDSFITYDFSLDKVLKSGQVVSEGSWDRLDKMLDAFIEGKLEKEGLKRALRNFELIEELL